MLFREDGRTRGRGCEITIGRRSILAPSPLRSHLRSCNLFARAKLRRIGDANTSYDTLRCTYDILTCTYVQLDALMKAVGCLNGVETL